MSEQVSVAISRPIFERLQKHASPLVDTTDTVIERLLDYWESHPRAKTPLNNSSSSATQQLWKSSRGDVLPVGKELKGTYLGKTYTAVVERGGIRFHGKLYDNLSPAAIAAKHLAGTTGKAASTNGRDFWRFRDPATDQWVPVSVLRPSHRIDANELLAELEKMP
jgi:hypothetical protein